MSDSNPDQVIRTYLLRRAQEALEDPEVSAWDVLLIDAAMRLGAFSDVDPIWLRWSYMLEERGLEEDNDRKLDTLERRAYKRGTYDPSRAYGLETPCCGAKVLHRACNYFEEGESESCPDCGDLARVNVSEDYPEDVRVWLAMGEEPRDNWPRPYGVQGCEAST